jgi:hypothetical protein
MPHTNPKTNTSSDVEVDTNKNIIENATSLYSIATALQDVAERILSQPNALLGTTSVSLTFFLPYNNRARDVFAAFQRRFAFTNIICTQYKRVHASVDKDTFAPVEINIMGDAKFVFDVKPISITKDAYYLNDELIKVED